MSKILMMILAAISCLLIGSDEGMVVMAKDDYVIDEFSDNGDGWEFITDGVMGGKSTGKMAVVPDGDKKLMYMKGKLSLENNGGFIQVRRRISTDSRYFNALTYKGVRIEVKGDGNDYAIHLRSNNTWLPWQYYEAKFPTTEDWQTLYLPFDDFKPYSLKKKLNISKLSTVAVVAIKEEFEPDIYVRRISMYAEKSEPDSGLRNELTEQEKYVIIEKSTERPFSGKYYMNFDDGAYRCRQCGAKLFESDSKFHSDCGWPSFDDEVPGSVKKQLDADGRRTEIVCNNCGGHLGHVFYGEKATAKNIRYCVNSVSLDFVPELVTEKAFFAGGCFWGVEYYFKTIDGVIEVTSGYTGGSVVEPTYKQVCSGKTGHAEAVEVVYDPSKVDFEKLCKMFFEIHDFTQNNRQGPDIGEQYRTEIFYSTDEQREIAERLINILSGKGYDVKTNLTGAEEFYSAEQYHQDYYEKNGKAPYCHTYRKIFD